MQSPKHQVSERRWPSKIGDEYIWKHVQCLTAQYFTGPLLVQFSSMPSKYICYAKSGCLYISTLCCKKSCGQWHQQLCSLAEHTAASAGLSYEPQSGVWDPKSFCLSRADLVPVYSFGENEVYKQVIFEEGSWGRWVQKKFQKHIGFAPCIFHGRGLFSSNTWGLLPYSKPITTVGKVLL